MSEPKASSGTPSIEAYADPVTCVGDPGDGGLSAIVTLTLRAWRLRSAGPPAHPGWLQHPVAARERDPPVPVSSIPSWQKSRIVHSHERPSLGCTSADRDMGCRGYFRRFTLAVSICEIVWTLPDMALTRHANLLGPAHDLVTALSFGRIKCSICALDHIFDPFSGAGKQPPRRIRSVGNQGLPESWRGSACARRGVRQPAPPWLHPHPAAPAETPLHQAGPRSPPNARRSGPPRQNHAAPDRRPDGRNGR